jgi:5S rRNA maturation endonuclease (ribonuclease M5)
MISTKNLELDENNVPSAWVFQYYLDLPERLTGQNVRIHSIFNPGERTPSMWVFVDNGTREYKYKDFSTGNYGNKIDLVKELYNLDFSKAIFKIINDYNKFTLEEGKYSIEVKNHAKYKVDYCHPREWNRLDQVFWLKFNIGRKMLTKYNVKPLEYYKMSKEDDEGLKSIRIEQPKLYGYFDKDDNVYKIYQPSQKKYKFIKVKAHLQGFDQLQYNEPYLVICSSLKDAMCLKSFGYNVEVIAPDSENTVIKPYIIENLKNKYKKVITLFDNDAAGVNAIAKYKQMFNIDGCHLTLSKDISDAVSDYGFDKVHHELKELLIKTLRS